MSLIVNSERHGFWTSSKYSPNLTVNRVAGALVASSLVGGVLYAALYGDVSGGYAIAYASSFAISSVTSVMQYLRGNSKDAGLWFLGTALCGVGHLLSKSLLHQNVEETCRQDGESPLPTRTNLLSCSLYTPAKKYIDGEELSRFPLASAGHTPVYLPEEHPIVIKQNGVDRSRELIAKAEEAQQLCQLNGFTCLEVPKVAIYKGFTIESRLPINTKNMFTEQMGLYVENYWLFDQAIKDFTSFLCQARFADIDGAHQELPFKGSRGRSDNVPLYLDSGSGSLIGKIGLVDLDHFSLVAKGTDLSHQIKDAVRLFPLHFKDILETAKKFYPDIAKSRRELEAVRDQSLTLISKMYVDHLNFILAKGVTVENADILPKLEPAQKTKLGKIVEKAILKEMQPHSPETLQLFKEGISKMIDLAMAFLRMVLKEEREGLVSTNPQLVSSRQVHVFDSDARFRKLLEEVGDQLTKFDLKPKDCSLVSLFFEQEIVEQIFSGLAKVGAIYHYLPVGNRSYFFY